MAKTAFLIFHNTRASETNVYRSAAHIHTTSILPFRRTNGRTDRRRHFISGMHGSPNWGKRESWPDERLCEYLFTMQFSSILIKKSLRERSRNTPCDPIINVIVNSLVYRKFSLVSEILLFLQKISFWSSAGILTRQWMGKVGLTWRSRSHRKSNCSAKINALSRENIWVW